MKMLEEFSQKNVKVLFILFVINAIALTYFGGYLKEYTPLPKLDFMICGYTKTTIISLISAYGDRGSNIYYWLTILDMPFPFLLFGFTVGYAVPRLKTWCYTYLARLVFLLAGVFLLFDMIENITVLTLFEYGFSWVNDRWIAVSSVATQIKLVSLVLIYSTLLFVWIRASFQKIKMDINPR